MIAASDPDPLVVAAWASLFSWVYVAVARGWFWRLGRVLRGAPRQKHAAPERRIAVVIPARDEAETIGAAVDSLLDQSYRGETRIFVVDDGSSDGTADAAGSDERLMVLQGAPLPDGWTGKMWAVEQGIRAAKDFRPDYILLTDADVLHARNNVKDLVARAELQDYDLVSLMVRLHCETLPERLMIPAFVWFFFMLYPPMWIADKRKSAAGAAGGCMLVRTSMLDKMGGIDVIRGELIDDCALAAGIKRVRGSVWLGLSQETRSLRVYSTFEDVWNMIARTAFTQLRYSPVLLAGSVVGLAFLYVVPPVLALMGHRPAQAAWLLMSFLYLPMLRYFGQSVLYAPLLPGVAAFYGSATVGSAMRYWRGEGGQWKGRAQASR